MIIEPSTDVTTMTGKKNDAVAVIVVRKALFPLLLVGLVEHT